MRGLSLLAVMLLTWSLPASAQIAEARRLYNKGEYEEAERVARQAISDPQSADAGRVVLGRIQLERYRQSADGADLVAARESLRAVDPRALDGFERVEFTVGLAEALYLADRYGAAALMFESLLDRAAILGAASRERVLDWWATAVDRLAQSRPPDERAEIYAPLIARMRDEVAQDPGSAAASYWLAAALRASGDLEGAWNAAVAGWVRGLLADDRGAALRADIDRLVVQAIIPERAARLQLRNTQQALTGMLNEWEAFKADWSR